MTFGSLFSGIGGLDLGLERAGMECRWQIEIDAFCRSVLELHWPGVKRYVDIRTVRGSDLEPVDLIAGGFPCQDVSQAGKRIGLLNADGTPTRSGLWFEFARIVREVRPQYVLAENTPGLLTLDGVMARVVRDLAGCGYVGLNLCLRASDFGGSHLRKRVFLVAYRHDERKRESGQSDEPTSRPRRHAERCGNDVAHRKEPRTTTTANERTQYQPDVRGRISSWSRTDREDMAHSAAGRRQELREPSRRDGFADGSDEALEDTGRRESEQRRYTQSSDLDGRRSPDHHCGTGRTLEDAAWNEQPGCKGESGRLWRRGVCEAGEQLDYAELAGLEIGDGQREQPLRQDAGTFAAGLPTFAPGPSDPRWPAILAERPDLAPALANPKRRNDGGQRSGHSHVRRDGTEGQVREPAGASLSGDAGHGSAPTESEIRGVVDGPADRLDRSEIENAMSDRTRRLKALGNAVVPQCAEWIGRRILEFESREHVA